MSLDQQHKTSLLLKLAEIEQSLEELVIETRTAFENHPCPDSDCAKESCLLHECVAPGAPSVVAPNVVPAPPDGFVCTGEGVPCTSPADAACPAGHWRSYAQSMVSTPPLTTPTTTQPFIEESENLLSEATSQVFTCASRFLDDDHWKAAHSANPNHLWTRQIVASVKGGVSRIFPAERQTKCKGDDDQGGECEGFNVKLQPWYVSSASGPKNVVLTLDVSGSMTSTDFPSSAAERPTRLQVIQPALIAILDSFAPSDHVGLVCFNHRITFETPDMLPATPENVATLQAEIADSHGAGSTSFYEPLRASLNILRRAEANPDLTLCVNIIIFFTDGRPTSDGSTDPQWDDAIRNGQASLTRKAHILAFTMSSGASLAIPQRIACENKGIWRHIDLYDDPRQVLGGSYFEFAEQLEPTLRWSFSPEEHDASRLVATASRPVILESARDGSKEIVAHAAVSVTLSDLWQAASLPADVEAAALDWLREEWGKFDASTCTALSAEEEQRQECRLQYVRDTARCAIGPTQAECGAMSQGGPLGEGAAGQCTEVVTAVRICPEDTVCPLKEGSDNIVTVDTTKCVVTECAANFDINSAENGCEQKLTLKEGNTLVTGCEVWDQMCPGEHSVYSAYDATPNPVPTGNAAGCLDSIVMPRWFFFKVLADSNHPSNGDGSINFQVSAPNDVDYAMYGPFDDFADLQVSCGSYAAPISCGYSEDATEDFSVNGFVGGKFYALLVSNFAEAEQDFTLKEMPGGTATIDCRPVEIPPEFREPTPEPTAEPTVEPTMEPTVMPTVEPTANPTTEPTALPTAAPTLTPTAEPTVEPEVETEMGLARGMEDSVGGMSTGWIVALAVLGALCFICTCCCFLYFCYRRRRRHRPDPKEEEEEADDDDSVVHVDESYDVDDEVGHYYNGTRAAAITGGSGGKFSASSSVIHVDEDDSMIDDDGDRRWRSRNSDSVVRVDESDDDGDGVGVGRLIHHNKFTHNDNDAHTTMQQQHTLFLNKHQQHHNMIMNNQSQQQQQQPLYQSSVYVLQQQQQQLRQQQNNNNNIYSYNNRRDNNVDPLEGDEDYAEL